MAVGTQGRGRSNSLPTSAVDYLKAWLLSPEHINHPYPTEQEKLEMCQQTGIDIKRLNNWFVNNRIRIWKPRFEAMQKQQKEQQQQQQLQQPQQTAPQVLPVATPQPPQSASEESYLQAIKALAAQKQTAVQAPALVLPRRVSLPVTNTSSSRLVHQVSDASLNASDSSSASSFESNQGPSQKRPAIQVSSVSFHTPPRSQKRARTSAVSPRFPQKDVEQWKQVCHSSPRLYDKSLPSLDEAACLFGYSSIMV